MKKNITKLMISVILLFFFMTQKSSSQNLLADGNFSTTTVITPVYEDPPGFPPLNIWCSWANYYGTGASVTTNVQSGVVTYLIDNPGINMYDVQLIQWGFPLQLDHRYRLSFDVKADAERDFGVFIGENGAPWINLNPSYIRHATANWQTITIDLDATSIFALHKLSFEMGIQKINMYFANVSLIDLGLIPVNKVVIAGTFQNELGCPGDWMPDCDNTALINNTSTGLWTGGFNIPAGCHQYKVTIDGSWNINYGEYGLKYGANISLYVPVETLITFTYDPETHLVTTSPTASGFSTSCLPQVVLAGMFQDELGCATDWDANCTNTALYYVPATGQFENDFNIPPGYYEYRTVLNGDWAGNNFGSDGIPNAANYSIYLPCATTIHFSYNPITHVVTATKLITNRVCVSKFYDANVNGYPDYGEEPMGGVTFTLTGNGITQTQTTGSDGKANFSNLPDGIYVVKESVPSGYYSSLIDSQYVYLFGYDAALYFGNVCIGAGGAMGIGFWTSSSGQAALNNSGKMEDVLWWLRYWGLRNADGTDFDPYTYAQLKAWMRGANAKNMTYMLSVQLAAMFLSTELGYVDRYNSYIYTPGCSWWGNFMNLDNLIWYTNFYLWYRTTVEGKDPERGYLDCLKTAFDNANNNLTFVQPHPCNDATTNRNKKETQEINNIVSLAEAKIWPNPSNNYFTLRPNNANNESVQLKVFNVNGQQVYTATGSSGKDYRFGERLIPGIYMVEFKQGNNRTTFKLLKQ